MYPAAVVKYIGETTRRLKQRVKEHQDACNGGFTIKKNLLQEHFLKLSNISEIVFN